MGKMVRRHEELEVDQLAFEAAMRIFELLKRFPVEERYALTDQVRRSSGSVCANLAEAWRKRIYEASFVANLSCGKLVLWQTCPVANLSDCTAEAAETQTWLAFAVQCQYLDKKAGDELHQTYARILGMLITLIQNSKTWSLSHPTTR